MSYNETIDNYLYDEENEYTQANDLCEDFFMEKQDEIDERPWIQADAMVHHNELNRQVSNMLDRVLPEEERELLRLYFGIGRRRHSMEELIALFDSERKVNTLLQSAMERLRYSDEILTILLVSTQIDDYLLHFACWLFSSSTSFTFMPPPTSYSRLVSLEPALLFTEGRGAEEDCRGFCSACGWAVRATLTIPFDSK